jgi:hypothetical protein
MNKLYTIQLKHKFWYIEFFTVVKWIICLMIILTMSKDLSAQSSAAFALSADGIDDFAYPLTPNAAGLSEGTIELWFSTDGLYSTLWCGGNGLPGVTGDWTRFGTHSSVGGNHLAFGIYSGAWRWASTGVVPDSGTWYHVAASWGPAGMKIYLNGTLVGQNSHSGGLQNYVTELVTASAWEIAYSGKIDELRIWNIVRDSSAIVRTLYDTLGSEYYSTSDSGLIAYYRMDDFEDLGINSDGTDDLRDLSVNANHLDTEGNPVLENSGAFTIVTGINHKSSETPHDFKLNQNYPNPFNPITTIEFNLPATQYTKLKVFGLLGNEVATIVAEKLNKGVHTYQFDASQFASGIYYYQLNSGTGQEIKKMVLLK